MTYRKADCAGHDRVYQVNSLRMFSSGQLSGFFLSISCRIPNFRPSSISRRGVQPALSATIPCGIRAFHSFALKKKSYKNYIFMSYINFINFSTVFYRFWSAIRSRERSSLYRRNLVGTGLRVQHTFQYGKNSLLKYERISFRSITAKLLLGFVMSCTYKIISH